MKIIYILSLLIIGAIFYSANPALAYDPYGGVDCSGAEASQSSACETSRGDNISGANGIIAGIASIIAYVGGAAAIIFIVIAAIRFITSGGDPGNIKKARDSVLYALIGIVVIILARTIIFYVLSFY